MEKVYPANVDETSCRRRMTPLKTAAGCYEQIGEFASAADFYTRYLAGAQYMIGLNVCDSDAFRDLIKPTRALILHNSQTPRVYAQTNTPSNVPNYN